MRNIHPELAKSRELLERFYEIIHYSTYHNAYHELSKWIIEAKRCNISELKEAVIN
ncbi:hypothetical protein RI065_01150 [Mycoplasmatota bacterium zrk1]